MQVILHGIISQKIDLFITTAMVKVKIGKDFPALNTVSTTP
jgi:hypothetical protein